MTEKEKEELYQEFKKRFATELNEAIKRNLSGDISWYDWTFKEVLKEFIKGKK